MTALKGRALAGWARLLSDQPLFLRLTGPQLAAVLGVGLPTLALSLGLWVVKRNVPIWDDGAAVLVERLPLTIDTLLAPFHEHLDAVPIFLWSLNQTPAVLLALLLATHVVLATGTALFLTVRLGPRPGFAFALPLGLLGSAHYDLLMPWQILYTIPLLCGLVATWLSTAEHASWPRVATVGILMAIAVASSNAGLFLVGALGLWYLFTGRWRLIVGLAPVLVLWGLWFLELGIHGSGGDGGFAITPNIVPYTAVGLTAGVGGLTGLGKTYGAAILAAGVLWVIERRPRPDPALASFAIAIVVMFMALSLFRSAQTVEYSDASRYIYIDGFFLAFGLGASRIRIPDWRWLVPLAGAAAALNLGILQRAWQYYP